jgi:hypothetical protein
MSTDVTYQEILAGFVVGVKELEAQWYSIKPPQNSIPSLADLLEVSAENLSMREHLTCQKSVKNSP